MQKQNPRKIQIISSSKSNQRINQDIYQSQPLDYSQERAMNRNIAANAAMTVFNIPFE